MQKYSLPMSEETYARLPGLLQVHGIAVEPHADINEFKMLRCRRDDVAILLSMSKPPHWAVATDVRRELVVVAVIGESMLRFWRVPAENRLRSEVIELLRPHAWSGTIS